MKLKWLPYDQSLDDYSRKEVSILLRSFLLVIPIVAIVLAAVNFWLKNYDIVLVILSVPIFCFISLAVLNHGFVNLSIIILIVVMLISTTLSCMLGNGVHETGIIILPVIVLFSSLIMNIKGVIITTLSVTLCLALIVFGEGYGLFPSREAGVARWVDLIVVITVIIIHAFVTNNFSNITKKNLDRVSLELINQKKYKEGIASNLDEKTELLRLVHHRVKNNLLLINSLIDIETYPTPEIKKELTELTSSIHTIARAHDPLYHTEDYKLVAIKPYLEKLIASIAQSMGINKLNVQLSDNLLFHEKALLLGIVLQRIMESIEPEHLEHVEIRVDPTEKGTLLNLSLPDKVVFDSAHRKLIQELIDELDAKIDVKRGNVSLEIRENLA